MDLLGPDESPPKVEAPEAWGVFAVSAVSRKGLDELLEGLYARVREVIEESWAGEPQPETYRP